MVKVFKMLSPSFFYIFVLYMLIFLVPTLSINIITNKVNKQLSMNLFETGLDLGIITAGTGLILDNTVSFNSTQIVKKSKDLYDEGYKKSNVNLLLLGPLYFSGVNYFVIHNYHSKVEFCEILPLVVIHNIG